MHLAPLNYDRFFKKVFSDVDIAKQFLEDFLDAEITEIEQLGDKHRVTDDAAIVEFDYRCKIKGKYIIIDMQQWYKPDVVKRFYLYHTLNTSLQLETLKTKLVVSDPAITSETRKQKDYLLVEPVYTLIWMVDDNLNFTGDYAEFSLTHQCVSNFIKDERLWLNPDINEIVKRHDEVVAITDNEFKDVNFLSENKLVFMFQRNIVENMKTNRTHNKYQRWFDFALRTKNKENIADDFKDFAKDSTFAEIIKRLRKDDLNKDDVKYIESEDENIRLTLDFYRNQKKLLAKVKLDGIEQERIKNHILQVKNVEAMLASGLSIEQASKFSGLSIDEINDLDIKF